jgi:hypothetical protein
MIDTGGGGINGSLTSLGHEPHRDENIIGLWKPRPPEAVAPRTRRTALYVRVSNCCPICTPARRAGDATHCPSSFQLEADQGDRLGEPNQAAQDACHGTPFASGFAKGAKAASDN